MRAFWRYASQNKDFKVYKNLKFPHFCLASYLKRFAIYEMCQKPLLKRWLLYVSMLYASTTIRPLLVLKYHKHPQTKSFTIEAIVFRQVSSAHLSSQILYNT